MEESRDSNASDDVHMVRCATQHVSAGGVAGVGEGNGLELCGVPGTFPRMPTQLKDLLWGATIFYVVRGRIPATFSYDGT